MTLIKKLIRFVIKLVGFSFLLLTGLFGVLTYISLWLADKVED